ncbi:MAG TPA: FecR domain-containing protein [Steroidobacteraceae bacterium]|jgi:transmembrane sensor
MTDVTEPEEPTQLPPEIIAEAGVWVARLGGPNAELSKKGVRRWLSESDAHRRAFDLATEVWEEAGALRGCAAAHLTRSKPPKRSGRKSFSSSAAACVAATAVAALVAGVFTFGGADFATGVGEQREVSLEDGSRVLMNTSTRLKVLYDKYQRRVDLEKGEARFDVTKNPNRPFVVTAGGREVTALGTSFDVRREPTEVSVVLIDGTVTVASVAESRNTAPTAPAEVTVLHPGQRLTFSAGRPARLDRPPLQRLTDWQRGRVTLDNSSLADAIAEMNRYSIVQLRVQRPEAAALRVSGIFRAGDSMSFARAVSQAYGLMPVEQANAILLTGTPQQQVRPATVVGSSDPDK